jgi:general secretion pathway protein F
MPIYSYKGLDKKGKEVKGSLNLESLPIAKQRIKSMGIMLIDISETKAKQSNSTINLGTGVNVDDLALMTRQLATLVKAKIQIVEALGALMDQVGNPTLRLILSEVKQKVNEGASLAKALSDHPKIFDNIYVNMVEAGEASGNLEIVLLRLADFKEAQAKLKTKIQGAMIYPMVMAGFGFVMMNIIFIFVIPKITSIFVSMKKELPLQTQICIWISDLLKNYWWALIIGAFVGFYLFKKYIATTQGEKNWHGFLMKVPHLGILIKMINTSRFCSTLATLLNSGVPILASMNIVKNLIPNVLMKEAIEQARISVQEGSSMTGPLIASGHFPPMVTHMITLGEKSGELEDMLKIVSESYQDQVESRIGKLTAVLEPIMMVVMGLAVAFIVFSVIVPMMSLNSMR